MVELLQRPSETEYEELSIKKEKVSTALVVIYNEVDYYPPTINAIYLLANRFQRVSVLEVINEGHVNDQYPVNVNLYSIRRQSKNYWSRLKTLKSFTRLYQQLRRKEEPKLILFYDPVAAMICWIGQTIFKKKEVYWYHNHDLIEKSIVKPFSILFFAGLLEKKAFPLFDLFTIPSTERADVYDLENFQGIWAIVPNYPSMCLYGSHSRPTSSSEHIKLIYQGNISQGHGLEEIIDLLPAQVNNKSIRLYLIGFRQPSYEAKLREKIIGKQLQDQVIFMDKVTYLKLTQTTRKHHIGVAVYAKTDIMNSTIGTASNKIYEYTASGLPFLYFKNPYFQQYLGQMDWAIPTDLSEASLLEAIQQIDDHYEYFSHKAKEEFLHRRNYENVFLPVLDSAIALIHSAEVRKENA